MTFIKKKSLLSFFLTSLLLSSSSMAMKEDDQNIQSFVLAKKDEFLPTQKEFENNMAISEKTLILYKQIFSLSEMVKDLQQQINPLIQKNKILNREICELKEKKILFKQLPFKPLKALLSHSSPLSWASYTDNASWKPVKFEVFEGNDESMKGEELSAIKIPENGVYSLMAHYCWHANNNGPTAPYTSISINEPYEGLHAHYFSHHHLKEGYEANDWLNRIAYLKKGEKVMLSICGSPNAEYCLFHFRLKVEKIN